MPRISAVLPRCQPVCSSATRICCRSTSRRDVGAELTLGANEPAAELKSAGTPACAAGVVNAAAGTDGRTTSGGNSLIVTRPLLERITARSRQFFNWRTFPGQLYARNASSACGSSSGGLVPELEPQSLEARSEEHTAELQSRENLV